MTKTIEKIFVIPISEWIYANDGVEIKTGSRNGEMSYIPIIVVNWGDGRELIVDMGQCVVLNKADGK